MASASDRNKLKCVNLLAHDADAPTDVRARDRFVDQGDRKVRIADDALPRRRFFV